MQNKQTKILMLIAMLASLQPMPVYSLNCDGSAPTWSVDDIIGDYTDSNNPINYVIKSVTPSTLTSYSCRERETYTVQKCGFDGDAISVINGVVTCSSQQTQQEWARPTPDLPDFDLSCPSTLKKKEKKIEWIRINRDEVCPSGVTRSVGERGGLECRKISYPVIDVASNTCSKLKTAETSETNFNSCSDLGLAMAQQNVAGELHSYARFVSDLSQCYSKVCQCREVPRELMQFNDNDGLLWTVHSGNQIRYMRSANSDDANKDLELMSRTSLSAITLTSKVVVQCPDQSCALGQYRTAQPTAFSCNSVCSDCVPPTWGYGEHLTCFAKTECPQNASAIDTFNSLPATHRNTMCKCNSNFYVTQQLQSFLPFKAYTIYEHGLFEGHLGQCTQCSSMSACNVVTQTLSACVDGFNSICVCTKGHFQKDNTCVPCQRSEYKEADYVQTTVPGANGVISSQHIQNSCQECPDIDRMDTHTTYPYASDETACDCSESWFYDEITGHNPDGMGKCKQCELQDRSKPYRAKGEKQCRDCPARTTFDAGECKPWQDSNMVMQIQCLSSEQKWTIFPTFDKFVRESTSSSIETLNSAHDYWMRAYANVNAKEWNTGDLFTACSKCTEDKYRIACGGPVRVVEDFGNEKYVIALSINQRPTLMTLDDRFRSNQTYDVICPQNKESENVTILRQGKCEKCIQCNNGEYVQGCGVNQGGVCTTCEKCFLPESALKPMQEYLDHPLNNQCNGSATQDCTRKRCERSFTKTNFDDEKLYYIQIHCGVHDVTIWDPDTPRLQDTTILSKTYTGLGKYHAGEPKHYCPTGYYVDTDCFTENSAWNPACCKLCTTHDALKRRGPGYQQCPGNRDSDTQEYVERCENGFFETEVDGERQCSQCETCSNL